MLWFDNDPKTALVAKIKNAAEYYRNKYGLTPNLCLVHPSMLDKTPPDGGKMTIRPLRAVLPGHLWIGMADKN
jgi:hypothetical protein